MNASCLQGILTFLLSAWVLTQKVIASSTATTTTAGSGFPPNHYKEGYSTSSSTRQQELVPVGDGLCPNATVSSVCDPDDLLSNDDFANIEALILEAYEGSWFACHDTHIRVKMGVYIRLHDRPRDKEDVTEMRYQWRIGEMTPCGNNGVLLYLTVSQDHRQAHVYLSPGDAMIPTLNRMVLQSVEDGMKPFLRHELYGEAIQAGILDLTAYVRGDKHFADLQEECLRDFYLSSWFFIFILYCCGGRLLLLVMHVYGRRGLEITTRARMHLLRQEVEEKLQEIDEHYQHKYPHHYGDYMARCCPICLEAFPTPSSSSGSASKSKPSTTTTGQQQATTAPALAPTPDPATEDTPLIFQKNQVGSDGKLIKSLPCGHVFDHTCIVDWMVTIRAKNRDARLSCPVCMESF